MCDIDLEREKGIKKRGNRDTGSMNPMSQSLRHFLVGSTLVTPLPPSSSHLLSHGLCCLPPLGHPPFLFFFTSAISLFYDSCED